MYHVRYILYFGGSCAKIYDISYILELIDMIETTCCFTGHRRLPPDKIKRIIKRLNDEIENLIRQGITDFMSGGGLGFDLIAASLIVAKKEMGCNIRLIFALPCHNQDEYWDENQKRLYQSLLEEADEIRYVSDEYSDGCMKKRNYYMVDCSAYCVCAFLNTKTRSGTGQTVRYAQRKGVRVINIAK